MLHLKMTDTPLGRVLLAADEQALVGVWFEGQKYYSLSVDTADAVWEQNPVLQKTERWLSDYFKGRQPELSELPLAPQGSVFRRKVWQLLCKIPYGETTTYGALAARLAKEMGKGRISAQAVGGAVGHNPVSVIIPCHRVVGSNGALTGYAGGLEKKRFLLQLEGRVLREKNGIWYDERPKMEKSSDGCKGREE